MTTVTVSRELLEEAASNCKASIIEDGISDSRRVYRTELHFRLRSVLDAPVAQPAQQEPVAWRWKVANSGWQLEDAAPNKVGSVVEPLYTAPVAQPAQQESIATMRVTDDLGATFTGIPNGTTFKAGDEFLIYRKGGTT